MLKIRLRRMGARNKPFYRVVVSDSRKCPTASALEEIGYYDPRKKPSEIAIDRDRATYWQERGAQVSPTVTDLLAKPNTTATATAATASRPQSTESSESAAAPVAASAESPAEEASSAEAT